MQAAQAAASSIRPFPARATAEVSAARGPAQPAGPSHGGLNGRSPEHAGSGMAAAPMAADGVPDPAAAAGDAQALAVALRQALSDVQALDAALRQALGCCEALIAGRSAGEQVELQRIFRPCLQGKE